MILGNSSPSARDHSKYNLIMTKVAITFPIKVTKNFCGKFKTIFTSFWDDPRKQFSICK